MYQWAAGQVSSLSGTDVLGNPATMVWAYVGYNADDANSKPAPGEPFDTHIVVGTGNPAAGGVSVALGIRLPAELQFDFSIAGFRCYFTNVTTGQAWDVTNDPGAACPQPPLTMLPNGYWNMNLRVVASFHIFEIRCPVVSSAPFQGKNLNAYVETEYGSLVLNKPMLVHAPQLAARLVVEDLPDMADYGELCKNVPSAR